MTGKKNMKAKNSPSGGFAVHTPALGSKLSHFNIKKTVCASSSEVAKKTDCTPVHRAGQPMGGERDEKTEAWAAAQPIRAKEMKKTCQTGQGIREGISNPPTKPS